MFPMDRKPQPVCIEYDVLDRRMRRTLPDEITARRFWIAKDKANKNPQVVTNTQEKGTATMATKTKTPAKKTETKKTTSKETVRVRALKAIAKAGELTAPAVQAAIGLSHNLKPTLDQEVERGNLAAVDQDGKAAYKLTAAGRKALAANSVDPLRATKAAATKTPAAKKAEATKAAAK